ncbi:putative monooxygenase [Kineosporia sp. NBRC 101731]|nr:FAD-dependent monooxygenase [Kineosporia sp. NBRC 101731]GLY32337.1 putative monooxygenase [Kineosporia sp. NBRC 101731]
MHVVVVGGGIGGLATAIGVAALGHRITVLERSPEFSELGAGIQIAPNGLHALDRLGVGDLVRRRAVRIEELRFMDGLSGAAVARMPLTGQYQERFGQPYLVVHRGELHTALLQRCRQNRLITLRAGCPVTGYRHEQDRRAQVRVQLADGGDVEGDVVIGADGVRSTVRRQLLDDGEPLVSGITVYRSIVPRDEVPDRLWNSAVTWWAGPGRHFVHYPIAGGDYLNLAPSHQDGASTAVSGVPVEASRVTSIFAEFAPQARELLELGRDWRSWVLVDRDPQATWCDGQVALLGDAAHPMLHYAAQGACQALEDVVVLSDHLARLGPDPGPEPLRTALRRYAEGRKRRTAAITRAARRSTELWHAAGEAATARNDLLARMSVQELHDGVAWMHGTTEFDQEVPAVPEFLVGTGA